MSCGLSSTSRSTSSEAARRALRNRPETALNPLRSEENAFRFFLLVLATAVAIAVVVLLLRAL